MAQMLNKFAAFFKMLFFGHNRYSPEAHNETRTMFSEKVETALAYHAAELTKGHFSKTENFVPYFRDFPKQFLLFEKGKNDLFIHVFPSPLAIEDVNSIVEQVHHFFHQATLANRSGAGLDTNTGFSLTAEKGKKVIN